MLNCAALTEKPVLYYWSRFKIQDARVKSPVIPPIFYHPKLPKYSLYGISIRGMHTELLIMNKQSFEASSVQDIAMNINV